MLPSETMIWQPEFTDKTLSRKPGAVHFHFSRIMILNQVEYIHFDPCPVFIFCRALNTYPGHRIRQDWQWVSFVYVDNSLLHCPVSPCPEKVTDPSGWRGRSENHDCPLFILSACLRRYSFRSA
ncbi:hypothetical protein CA901_024535 (plasmid) [Escherichia coli]|nr:hypothetical protein CA901_024535 [Escherichia coli]